jgi:hypothetical protein
MAIEELQRQSGYQIIVQGDRAPLAARNITLETGEVPFWEALDKLCQAGALREVRAEPNPALDRSAELTRLQLLREAEIRMLQQQIQLQQQAQPAMPVPLPKAGVQPVPVPKVAPGAPAQAQAQVRAAQLQAMAEAIRQQEMALGMQGLSANKANTIVIRDAQVEKLPTTYCGALRIRMLPSNTASDLLTKFGQPAQTSDAVLVLDVSPEPRLRNFAVVGSARIDKAIDDQGQSLTAVLEQPHKPADFAGMVLVEFGANLQLLGSPTTTVRLKLGEKKAKTLIELSGTLTIQAQSPVPDPLVTVDDVLKSEGKTVKGQGDASAQVLKIEKMPNGSYRVQVRYEGPLSVLMGKTVIAAGAPRLANPMLNEGTFGRTGLPPTPGLPVLLDANGKALSVEQILSTQSNRSNGHFSETAMLVFRAAQGVGEPAQLVLYNYRMVTTQVPFRFENVALP